MSSQSTQPDPHLWQPGYPPAPPAPMPKKGWFARHKVLTGLLAIALLGIVIGALGGGGGKVADSATVAPAGGSAGVAAGDGTPAAKVGSAVRDGNFEFTVTKVQRGVASVGSDIVGEKAQGQFVLIHVTVRNIGAESQLLMDSAQTVRDVQGRKFSPDTVAALSIKDNDVFVNEINPGNTVKGVLVFDMPKNTAPASIELHDSAFSGGVTVSLR